MTAAGSYDVYPVKFWSAWTGKEERLPIDDDEGEWRDAHCFGQNLGSFSNFR